MKKISILILILAMILLSTGYVYAKSGSSGEPGSGCADQAIKYKYETPPYMGQITAVWIEGGPYGDGMYVSGTVEQVGNSTCVGAINPPAFFKAMTLDEFQSLKSNDIKGACLAGYGQFFPSCQPVFDAYEIVGAGDLKFATPKSFTFSAVIMQLGLK